MERQERRSWRCIILKTYDMYRRLGKNEKKIVKKYLLELYID